MTMDNEPIAQSKTPSRALAASLVNAMLATQHVSSKVELIDIAENYIAKALQAWQDELIRGVAEELAERQERARQQAVKSWEGEGW